jgi:hypothetical protein
MSMELQGKTGGRVLNVTTGKYEVTRHRSG